MLGRLSARKVTTAKPGKYSDGGNLYLIVNETGSRKSVLRFTWRGRAKSLGLEIPPALLGRADEFSDLSFLPNITTQLNL